MEEEGMDWESVHEELFMQLLVQELCTPSEFFKRLQSHLKSKCHQRYVNGPQGMGSASHVSGPPTRGHPTQRVRLASSAPGMINSQNDNEVDQLAQEYDESLTIVDEGLMVRGPNGKIRISVEIGGTLLQPSLHNDRGALYFVGTGKHAEIHVEADRAEENNNSVSTGLKAVLETTTREGDTTVSSEHTVDLDSESRNRPQSLFDPNHNEVMNCWVLKDNQNTQWFRIILKI
mmetsp:Transcript_43387/g.67960  ORF Transcript_43387/g.67960 Transcript_43387/m.67960 type:complete len:232 (-) Transcript_43387:398-1093(-)